jgi:hypothetical protein
MSENKLVSSYESVVQLVEKRYSTALGVAKERPVIKWKSDGGPWKSGEGSRTAARGRSRGGGKQVAKAKG